MTSEQKEFLLDLAEFMIDAAKSKEKRYQNLESVLFTVTHDIQGLGKKCFLPRTYNWRKKKGE